MTNPVRPGDVPAPSLFDGPPPAGHNNPPPFDPQIYEEKKAEVLAFVDAAGEWLDLGKIENDEQAGYLNDFVAGARKKKTQIEAWRVAAKEPHRTAAEAVDNAAKPLAAKLETSIGRALKLAGDYAIEKKRKADEAAAAARKKADEERAQAERDRLAAIARNDISGEKDAEAKTKEVEKDARAAERLAESAGQVKSATGAGRTISLVKIKTAQIDNIRLAFMAVQDDPIVVEGIQRALNQKIRAAGFDGTIPGVTIKITEQAR